MVIMGRLWSCSDDGDELDRAALEGLSQCRCLLVRRCLMRFLRIFSICGGGDGGCGALRLRRIFDLDRASVSDYYGGYGGGCDVYGDCGCCSCCLSRVRSSIVCCCLLRLCCADLLLS